MALLPRCGSAMSVLGEVLTSVSPVFGIILLGFLLARHGGISKDTGPGLAAFIFTFAVPALIFRTIVVADLGQLDIVPVIGAFFGGAAVVWVLGSLIAAIAMRRSAEETAALGFAVGFGNVLILGIPILINQFGPSALPPLLVIVALDIPIMWVAATVQIAVFRPSGGVPLGQSLWRVLVTLIRNPVIVAAFLGIAVRQAGTGVPDVADRVIDLLGQAALPGALFSLGMTLSTFQLRGAAGMLSVIGTLKLAVMPLIVWILAVHVFGLASRDVAILTLAAACPVGINAYLFAARTGAMAQNVAAAIAVTTAISAGTLSLALGLLALI